MITHEHCGAVREAPSEPRGLEASIGVTVSQVYHTTAKVLLLGEDNPQSAALEHALYDYPPGCAGHRLRTKILGLAESTYLSLWRTNLCNPTWSLPAARARAEDVVYGDHPWSTIIMLGRKVATAVDDAIRARIKRNGAVPGFRDLEPFTHTTVTGSDGCGVTLVSIPHPSGRSRAWNVPTNMLVARGLLYDVLPSIPWGEACST